MANVLNIFFQENESLEKTAEKAAIALQLPPFELRFGLNVGGGNYYNSKVLGLELSLVSNKGEVLIDEYASFQFYFLVISRIGFPDAAQFRVLVDYIATLLRQSGIVCEVSDTV